MTSNADVQNRTEAQPVQFQHSTMARSVTEHLRSEILAGRIAPGDRLQQDAIASQLGISRIPVREALQTLQSEGLVELRPHRGAIVVSLCPEDIVEIFGIRATLEMRAAEMAAARLTDSDLSRLREIYLEMDKIVSGENEERWLALTREFHTTISSACGWPRLCALIETQINALQPYWRASFSLIERMPTEHREHYQILLAAEERDGGKLSRIIADHLHTTAQELNAYLSLHRT